MIPHIVRLLFLFAATLAAPGASAHNVAHDKQPKPVAEDFTAIERKSRDYFGETQLVDQYNRSVRFYSDVLRGKTVLINVIYTDCKDACPIITRKLVEVRKTLPASLREIGRAHV